MTMSGTGYGFAPVVLFVYCRAAHTKQTVEALKCNPEAADTALIVYSDAPANAEMEPCVAEVRRYIRSITGFSSLKIFERERNFGLANSIISGVSEQLQQHGRLIVMEDDLVVSPFFLSFMNEGLRRYVDDDRVASIHGYMYPVDINLPETFFLEGADCSGWVTWLRAWLNFEADGRKLAAALQRRKLVKSFNLGGRYPYFRMLRQQILGKNDSWAIRWHASAFLAGLVTLYPGRSHVANIGTDGTGSHCRTNISLGDVLSDRPTRWSEVPVEVKVAVREALGKYFVRLRIRLFWARVWRIFRLSPRGSLIQ